MLRLEKVANVILRVPSIVLLDLLYRWDVQASAGLLRSRTEESYLWNIYYAGHLVCVVVLLLPVQSLVKLYLYILTVLLLYVGHQTSQDYIRHEMEREFHGAVYHDPVALSRFATALTGQVIVITLCALLLKTRRVWLFSAPLLPLVARLCCFPLHTLPVVHNFAAVLTALEALYVVSSCLSVPFHLAAAACREIAQVLEVYRLVTLGMSLWRQLAIPLLFLVFWLALFTLQLYALAAASSGKLLSQQGLLFIFLSSVAECCSTPYSLIGLTFTVSYLALGLLKLCKFYLAGYGAFQNGNVMHRGVTEGVTLLLLALQTGLLDLQLLQRTFLLSIILFIVVTSTLQSMIEIADPIVLGLGASRNRSLWKHFRGVTMCLFLLVFPGFMAYKIAHFFHMDFWLLILVSSCMLTSLQVMGTLFIYVLFMIELFQETPMEKMDEIIYYVNAISRVLEFLVALCVVAYGTWESIFGEWSWMGASVIIIHCYFNVWLRAQSGWKSFLLRREAARKISVLPRATRGQLQDHNDVCAICFQEMTLAVITHCGHFFHGGCLRKWFYVQSTCPLCHQPVTLTAGEEGHANRGSMQGAEEPHLEEEAVAVAPHPEGGEALACFSETAEAEESSGRGEQGSFSAGPTKEEPWPEPAVGSGAPRELEPKSIPGHGPPWKELETITKPDTGGQGPVRLGHPPTPGSPRTLQAGDPASPGESAAAVRAREPRGGWPKVPGPASASGEQMG
ncbi:RING finger protein 145-like isoform X2 [Tiliqua scincoides]|uniref:RING finger protein 145-like isoform X2 n=1 Tax=Tiliqua scincoides TaxID=71010 RepID=UPI003461CC2C